MNWFRDLQTRTKLALTFSAVILLLVANTITAWHHLDEIFEVERALDDSLSLRVNVHSQRAALLGALVVPSDDKRDAYLAEVAEHSQLNQEIISRLKNKFRDERELLVQVEQIDSALQEIKRIRDNDVVPLIRQQKKEEAAAMIYGPQFEQVEKIRDVSRQLSTQLDAKSVANLPRAHTILLTLGGAATLVAIISVLGVSRAIATPLRKITMAADKIAEGDINVDIEEQTRRDEIGVLDQAFRRMCESLQGFTRRAQRISQGDLSSNIPPRSERDVLGAAFATMTTELRKLIQELLDAVNILASSASDIMASTSQLAASAMETATAVTETTATVEEVKQTSQVASEKARQVADSAQQSAEIARNGKASVEETVKGMNSIRGQMDTVAESILSLSAQGQSIGEIIATVDDLAAQSKLLAVNASIEAAKAGDEGKGFAVVAQEVRSLAEQSKQATTQVRGILSDIQKATSSAVLATEQGGKTVEVGVRQSAASGESINSLADSITQAAQASMQIAASSQQQFVGMDQVAQAMINIKTASVQTVASTKQAEIAAQQLHELGVKLKQLVGRFQV